MTDKEKDERKGPDVCICLTMGPIRVMVPIEHYRALKEVAKHATVVIAFEDGEGYELLERNLGIAISLNGSTKERVNDVTESPDVSTRH